MTVGEIREVSQPSARAWIEKDGNVLFADWFYKVPEDLLKAKVKEFAFAPEINVTTPEGKKYCTNLKLKQEDLEFFQTLSEMGSQH